MKKTAIILGLILCSWFTAQAQTTGGGVTIKDIQTNVSGDMLDIRFNIAATGLDIKCDGHLIVEFAVETDERRLVLPTVVYSGNLRYRYERRNALLSDSYQMEPYRIFKGVKENRTYETDYTLSMPYYTWMEHATVTYREYLHDCSGEYLAGNGQLVGDLNPTVFAEPEMWRPESSLFPNIVSFLVPEVEDVKARASMVELNINFPVNITEVRPTYMNNPAELARADSLIHYLNGNQHININGVNIKGYASPEGSYANNERLAKGRSEGFKRYMANAYPQNQFIRNATTLWVPEDWEGLAKLVRESNIPNKDEVLNVVLDRNMSPDTKEEVLKKIGQWSYVYKPILDEMFPKLRRIELRVDYTVNQVNDHQARELLYTDPRMLSLEEIYRVARFYTPGSQQYREVYQIAAQLFPDDVVANNNAAAALLQEGKAAEALPYLEKIKGETESYINYGAYHYITGDLDKAIEYFVMAKGAGYEQADSNLRLINTGGNR